MKKLLPLFTILLMVFVLVACGGDDEEPTPEPTSPPAQEVEAEAPDPTTAPEPTQAPEPTAAPEAESDTDAGAGVSVPESMIELPAVDPLSISGDIITAGSSTVFPLAERMAERFVNEGYGGNITIDSIGSGAGFERFCTAGETDISNASRGIKDAEVENCGAIDRAPIEFRVGTDAIAVTINPGNEVLAGGVTMEELAKIFSSEAVTWADVNAAWPAEEIKRFSPGTDSGTYDFFIEEVMEPVYGEEAEKVFLEAKNLQLSEDDNVLVQGVAGDANGIGYFGFAYYQENQDKINALPLDGIEADSASVDSGDYPLARPLFMYSDPGVMQSKSQVSDYLNFVLTFVNDEIIDVGYFPVSEEALNQSKQNWLDAMGATVEAKAAPAEEAAAGPAELPAVDPLTVSGDIITAGSSTVFPLSERMAERFVNEGYGGNITIDSIGSGAGFERFCTAGETDISNASRGIKDAEVENCGAIDRAPIEFRVGTDAIAVTINPGNEVLAGGVTMEELAKIFSSEAVTWADVNAAWPAEEIKRFSPGTDSGTYDFFIEEVMEPVYGEEAEKVFLEAKSLQLSEDDNVLVQGVAGDANGIGYFGFAYFQENQDKINALALDGVDADGASVESGEYPLARPLFMYSDAGVLQSKGQVSDFLNFVLTYVNDEIVDVGYFPASEDALNRSKQNWLDAMTQ